jgi:hypothetical protein
VGRGKSEGCLIELTTATKRAAGYTISVVIPEFNDLGYLPPGVHIATIDEVVARFGHGDAQREAQAESLQWLLSLCQEAGVSRMLINGSFVTSRVEPNDVDIALLQGPDYVASSNAAAEIRQGLPFLDIKVVAVDDYEFFLRSLFVRDRARIAKGVIEVSL